MHVALGYVRLGDVEKLAALADGSGAAKVRAKRVGDATAGRFRENQAFSQFSIRLGRHRLHTRVHHQCWEAT